MQREVSAFIAEWRGESNLGEVHPGEGGHGDDASGMTPECALRRRVRAERVRGMLCACAVGAWCRPGSGQGKGKGEWARPRRF